MQIGDGPTTVLQIDGTVAAGNAVRFLGDAGTLELTNFSSGVLQGFSGTIAGLNVGSSPTVPTNEIDLAGIAPTGIALAELDAVTDTITVTTTANQSFTLQLSGSYDAGARVDLIGDGNGGTELFLDLITGNFVSRPGANVYICEQLASGIPDPDNSILVGYSLTTQIAGIFARHEPENFADTVVLQGFTAYALGETGMAGDIFFVDSNGNIISVGTADGDVTNLVSTVVSASQGPTGATGAGGATGAARERPERRAQRELPELPDQRELPDQQVLLVKPGRRVPPAQRVRPAQPGTRVRREPRVRGVRPGQRVRLAPPGTRGRRAPRVRRV
jgi:hypothetical protein